jgi:phosphate/sulfate permease
MFEPFWFLILIPFLPVAFDFVNGWTDACNSIATVFFILFLFPNVAVSMTPFFSLAGILSITAVAITVEKGVSRIREDRPFVEQLIIEST